MENTLRSTAINSSRSGTLTKSMLSAIITGQIAGLIMAVVVMLVFTILGKGPLFPVQVIGSVVFGESALHGFHLGALLTGLVLHQAGPSLLWGTVFGLMVRRSESISTAKALSLGLILGAVSMVGPYLLIPMVMKTMQGADYWNREVPLFYDWAAHIVFGAAFALFPKVRAKL